MAVKAIWKKLSMWMILLGIAVVFAACNDSSNDAEQVEDDDTNVEKTENTPIASKVDGVSDQVYQELIEFYFYLTTFTEMMIENIENEEKQKMDWHKDHILYEEAIAYVEEHEEDIYLMSVFPNPLLYEHHENPDNYTKEEKQYIDMIAEYMEASNRMNIKDYTALKKEIKDALNIDQADNMFP